MALWHKIKRIANSAKTRAKLAIKKMMNSRPIILRSVFAKNSAVIVRSLFYKRDRLKPAICKQTQMIAEMKIPKMLRKPLFTAYSKFYKVNVKQIQKPLFDYPTFCDFFTRRVVRPLPEYINNTVSSPCDGKVLTFEQVTGDKCHIIKKASYSLSQLVTGTCTINTHHPQQIVNTLKMRKDSKLYQLVVYLAPGDYHRFHSPVDMQIINRKPIEGKCDSVSQSTIAKGKPIYQKNGRISVTARWKEGLMTLVMVGALNVMRIHITQQNNLKRGDQLGLFNLGSTIVMIIEAKDLHQWMVTPGQKIKYGQPLLQYIPQ